MKYRLIHVKQGVLGICRMIEVSVDSSNLNSNDTFILIANEQATCWIGKGLLNFVVLFYCVFNLSFDFKAG